MVCSVSFRPVEDSQKSKMEPEEQHLQLTFGLHMGTHTNITGSDFWEKKSIKSNPTVDNSPQHRVVCPKSRWKDLRTSFLMWVLVLP